MGYNSEDDYEAGVNAATSSSATSSLLDGTSTPASGSRNSTTHKKDFNGYGSLEDIDINDKDAVAASNTFTEEDRDESSGIARALAIPGVVEFALSLFFCKFVA